MPAGRQLGWARTNALPEGIKLLIGRLVLLKSCQPPPDIFGRALDIIVKLVKGS